MLVSGIILAALLLDFLLGDPSWLTHPVVVIGKAISMMERDLRRIFPKTQAGERTAGRVMAAAIPLMTLVVACVTMLLAGSVHMGLWVALELLDPKAYVTAGEETTWIDPDSSRAWVTPGDTMQVERLIQGMMMQSGNDAAYATAVAAGYLLGDEATTAEQALALFMEQVNQRAQELGFTGTHFVTPDGIHDENHYTTPRDLLGMALLAMEQSLMRHYSSIAEARVMYENGEFYTYKSTNWLLNPNYAHYSPDACGMKTGTTNAAGSCLIALFHNGERYILIGVLGCPKYEDRFLDALHLYEKYGG
jgi:D-alanyl-D-alanine carboxypeptidase